MGNVFEKVIVEGKKNPTAFSSEENTQRLRKKKEKKESGVEALQSCDRGSHPSSFLLLVLCSTP